MLMHFCQNAISIVGGDDVGIEEPVKELCPCLPREVCPHNHALSSSVSKKKDRDFKFITKTQLVVINLASYAEWEYFYSIPIDSFSAHSCPN